MSSIAGWFWPFRRPWAWVPLTLGAASIGVLLVYFQGSLAMGVGARWILLPAAMGLAAFTLWRRGRGDDELVERIVAGVWAGALATLAYDLVRVPISMSGVPVFKAISYFGTLILGQVHPSVGSEVAGWSYHLSNGIGFGLMYAVAVRRPRLWSALLWGLSLEAVMLLTPYAEVFGYRISSRFLAITIGSHLVYGAVLWAGLALWKKKSPSFSNRRWLGQSLVLFLLAPVGIGWIAAGFFSRHAASIPPSPPATIGPHLYVAWNVPEPDRVALLWIQSRFVDRKARFSYVEPFSQIPFGTAIDTPEAKIRRTAVRSGTENLLAQSQLSDDAKLELLGQMTHLYEIVGWQLPTNPPAYELGRALMDAVGTCGGTNVHTCYERGFDFLDEWYASGSNSDQSLNRLRPGGSTASDGTSMETRSTIPSIKWRSTVSARSSGAAESSSQIPGAMDQGGRTESCSCQDSIEMSPSGTR